MIEAPPGCRNSHYRGQRHSQSAPGSALWRHRWKAAADHLALILVAATGMNQVRGRQVPSSRTLAKNAE
jgi:hypothetical protein